MPKRTNPNAHSFDKQSFRQLLSLYEDVAVSGSALTITDADFAVHVAMPDDISPAVGFFSGTKGLKLQLKDSDGNICKWYNSEGETVVITVTTAGDGDVTGAPSMTADFVEGEAILSLPFTGTWASSDTLTIGTAATVYMFANAIVPYFGDNASRTFTVA